MQLLFSSQSRSTVSRSRRPASAALLFLAVVIAGGLGSQSAIAKEPLGRRWPAAQQKSMDEIDYTGWSRLVQKYVDQDGMVNYAAWHRSRNDRQQLRQVLEEFSRASLKDQPSTDGKLAFWINAYNAVTIEGILQEYPTTSIRNHTAKVFGYNIWKELPLIVGDSPFSLHEMEHNVLRKLNEPRIHFAIVCASVGCPRLLNKAYEPRTVRRQLYVNTTDFFSRPRNFRYDPGNRTVHLSSILDWYSDDFGSNERALLQAIKPWLPKQSQRLADDSGTSIRYIDYDWSLNAQSGTR